MSCQIPDNHLTGWGLVWCEPMTFATDALLALLCLVLMTRHRGAARGFFAFSAAAFFLGGFKHLLAVESPDLVPLLSRASSTTSALSLAALPVALPALWPRRIDAAAWGLAAVMIAGHLWLDHFGLAVAHTAIVFSAVLGAVLRSRQLQAHRWFLIAFALSAIAGVIFASQRGLALFFNHNDLAHVVLLGAHVSLHRQLTESARSSLPGSPGAAPG